MYILVKNLNGRLIFIMDNEVDFEVLLNELKGLLVQSFFKKKDYYPKAFFDLKGRILENDEILQFFGVLVECKSLLFGGFIEEKTEEKKELRMIDASIHAGEKIEIYEDTLITGKINPGAIVQVYAKLYVMQGVFGIIEVQSEEACISSQRFKNATIRFFGKSIHHFTTFEMSLVYYKECLIDGDFGLKNLDVMMGLENRVVYDLNDVISGKCEIHQVLVKDKREQMLYLLPACKTLSFQNLDASIMAALIDYLKNDFDFIIVDSPAGIEQGFTYASSIADEAIIVVNLDLATLRDNDRVIGLLLKKGIQDLKLIINKVNLDDIEDGKSLTIDDALDILSLPLLGIVYEDHEMIEANNKGRPVYLLKGHLLHDCFDNIAHRLLGHKRAFAKCKRRGLLSRIFLG